MKRATIVALASTALLGLIWLSGCGARQSANDKSKAKKPPLVRVSAAVEQDISRVIELTGSIEPTKVACMASPAEGPIVECPVREGDEATRNKTLARVGRSEAADAAVRAATEELAKQTGDIERVKKLVESGAIPGDQLDAAKANVEKAKAALAAAETQAGDYEITAPWDGIVSKVWIAEGNYVAPRAKLVEIFDPKSLVLRFALPEVSAGQVHKGLTLDVRLDAYPGQLSNAQVVRVYPELDRATRTRTVEALLTDPVPSLVPGMFARVSLKTQTAKAATVVPDSAVLVNPKGDSIVFVVADGKAHVRKVEVGIEAGHLVQIVEGVTPGELVTVAGHERLRDGAPVRVPQPKAASAQSAGKQ